MARKHEGESRASGWPRGRKASQRQSQAEAISSLADQIAAGRVPEAEVQHYARRLVEILRSREEFQLVRPELATFHEALAGLPQHDLGAMLQPHTSPRRARKARAEVFPRMFDAEFYGLFAGALQAAVSHVGSRDDLGALALAVFALRGWSGGSLPVEDNPLLALLFGILMDDFAAMAKAVDELNALGTASPEADPAEQQRRRDEVLAKHPVFEQNIARRTFKLTQRLMHYIERGVIRAHLTAEEIAPLVAVAPAEADAAGAARLVETITAFANDPAHDPLFARFAEAMAAEAKEAADKGDPLAQRLEPLVAFIRFAAEPDSPIRAMVCQASLQRVLREMQPPGDAGTTQPASARSEDA